MLKVSIMSNKSDSDDTSEVQNVFFKTMIDELLEKYPDLDKKCIFKLLVKKIKYYYIRKIMMEDDNLWDKVVNEANTYKDDVNDTGASDSAAIEYAVKEFKPIIMEMISDSINEEEDIEEEEEEEDVNESAVINNQSGEGCSYSGRRYRNLF